MKHLGMVLLAVWLIATGLRAVIGLSFAYDTVVFGVLAIVAGILLLARR